MTDKPKMNITLAESIAADPSKFLGATRIEAFYWADAKRFDKSVSESLRKRSEVVFFTLFNWAQKTFGPPKKFTSF